MGQAPKFGQNPQRPTRGGGWPSPNPIQPSSRIRHLFRPSPKFFPRRRKTLGDSHPDRFRPIGLAARRSSPSEPGDDAKTLIVVAYSNVRLTRGILNRELLARPAGGNGYLPGAGKEALTFQLLASHRTPRAAAGFGAQTRPFLMDSASRRVRQRSGENSQAGPALNQGWWTNPGSEGCYGLCAPIPPNLVISRPKTRGLTAGIHAPLGVKCYPACYPFRNLSASFSHNLLI